MQHFTRLICRSSPRILLCLIFSTAIAFAKPKVDLVLDLDWTCIYPIPESEAATDPSSVIRADRQYFRMADFLIPVLRYLHRTGNYRISFYSGGGEVRNQQAIMEIYRRVNASFTNASPPYAPFKILSRPDLNQIGDPNQMPFAEAYKKDLQKLGSDTKLGWTVLVDDQAEFAMKGQERNMLYLGATYIDVVDYDTWSKTDRSGVVNRRYDPPDQMSWAMERSKLLYVVDLIETAVLNAEKSGREFIEIVAQLQTSARIAETGIQNDIGARFRARSLIQDQWQESSREQTVIADLKAWTATCEALSTARH